jgi:hypothetical protein
MTTAEIIAWAEDQDAAGKRDAMGHPFTSWLVARRNTDGTAMRDERGHQVFETQAESKARAQATPINMPALGQTMDLFA